MTISRQHFVKLFGSKSARSKPYPQPGDVWKYTGKPSFEGTVVGSRVFQGETQIIFNDGSVAGAYHIMSNDAWQYVRTVDLMPHYREIFKTAYTRAVMSGLPIRDGILAGARAVHGAVGNHDRAINVLGDLRARLGDVLGDPS